VGDGSGVRGEGKMEVDVLAAALLGGGVGVLMWGRWVVILPLTFGALAVFSLCGGASSILSSRSANALVVRGGGGAVGRFSFFFFLSSNFFLYIKEGLL
jgi:hypothetical protein